MKNIKTKIILSAIVLLSVVGFAGAVEAASLYVSPSNVQKNAGEIMNVSVRVNPSGKNICLVEGRIVFNNLSCQSITVAGDLMAQSTPSCSNPYFLIGIPGCSLTDKDIFNISVRTGSAGKGTISFINVDVVGEGVSVSNNSVGGSYNIISATPSVPPITEQPVTTEKTEEAVAGESIVEEEEVVETKREPFVFETQEFLMLSSANLALAAIGESPTLTTIFVLCFIALALVGTREAFLLIERKKIKDKKKY